MYSLAFSKNPVEFVCSKSAAYGPVFKATILHHKSAFCAGYKESLQLITNTSDSFSCAGQSHITHKGIRERNKTEIHCGQIRELDKGEREREEKRRKNKEDRSLESTRLMLLR